MFIKIYLFVEVNYFFVVLIVYLFVSSLNLFSFNIEVFCDRVFEFVFVGFVCCVLLDFWLLIVFFFF